MSDTTFEKEVRFDIWCKKCIYKDQEETLDPCNDCLDAPYNQNTSKPVNFKEAE